MERIPVRKFRNQAHQAEVGERFGIKALQDLLQGEDMIQKAHRHDFFLLLAFEKATGIHTIDFHTHELESHTVFMLRPGQVHALQLSSDAKGYLISFQASLLQKGELHNNQLLSGIRRFPLSRFTSSEYEKLSLLMDRMLTEQRERKPNFSTVIEASLNILLVELIRHMDTAKEDISSPYMLEQFDRFSELLDKYLCEQKKVSDYASMMNISPFQLNQLTKTMLDKTASEAISDRLILEAKRHLLVTSLQVKEIAMLLGFEDVSYFTRFFRKQVDLTPLAFRENLI